MQEVATTINELVSQVNSLIAERDQCRHLPAGTPFQFQVMVAPDKNNVAMVSRFDGTTTESNQYPALMVNGHAKGDVVICELVGACAGFMPPAQGATTQMPVQYNGVDVLLRETTSTPIFVQITTAANSSGVAGVKRYDGTSQSGSEFFVRVVSHGGVNEKLWVAPVSPNANVSDTSGNKVPWMEFTSNATFRVKVTQNGGSAGSGTAYCTYTYDIKDAATGAITLATAQSVLYARPVKAACIAAGTNGIAEINAGNILLISVDEQFKTTAC